MRFSQRIGKTSVRDSIQIESIDEKLENRLWNTILFNFFDKIKDNSNYYNVESHEVAVYVHI